jgi:hypothetical protein
VASAGAAKFSLALRRSAEPGSQVASGASFARAATVTALGQQALVEGTHRAEGLHTLAQEPMTHELLAQEREVEHNTSSRLQRSLEGA